jgi:hypothetical protein
LNLSGIHGSYDLFKGIRGSKGLRLRPPHKFFNQKMLFNYELSWACVIITKDSSNDLITLLKL